MFRAVTILLGVVTLGHCLKIADDMTSDEIATVFRTTRNAVPYRSTQRILTKDALFSNGLNISYNDAGQRIYDYLEPTNGLLFRSNTPVWLASGDKNGNIKYTKMKDGIIGENIKSSDSPLRYNPLVIRLDRHRRTPHKDGRQLSVRPVKSRLQENVKRNRGIDPASDQTESGDNAYPMIETDLSESAMEGAESTTVKGGEEATSENKYIDHETKNSTEDVLILSIMVTTDFCENDWEWRDWVSSAEIAYQVAFWNGVDLRFRQFRNPKVRLRIAGLIIGLNPEANPWMKKAEGAESVDARYAWARLMFYASTMPKLPEFNGTNFDYVITLTRTPLGERGPNGITSNTKGIAFPAQVCKTGGSSFFPAAIARDDGAFGGVLPTAHEIGHLLGLHHDVKTKNGCSSDQGYVMDEFLRARGANQLFWSNCSLEKLSELATNGEFDCIKNPKEFHRTGRPVDVVLPGFILGADEQCKARGYSFACKLTPGICKALKCSNSYIKNVLGMDPDCNESLPAAEGTVCDTYKRCINGECKCVLTSCVESEREVSILLSPSHFNTTNE